ncbi:hypothetical protein ISU74_18150, partial [Leptospira borgpetersenii serovar Ballum]|nr:hypothetical protein [Leptospira borgpetersenii serovar Ballum]
IIEHRDDGLTFHYKAIDQVRADGQQLVNQAMGGILQDSINEMGAKAVLKGGGNPLEGNKLSDLFFRQFDHFDLRDSTLSFITISGQRAELAVPQLTWLNG